MTRHDITDAFVHTLVTTTHSEGIYDLDVAAAINHRDQALLVGSSDEPHLLKLPATAVWPGEHLLDALCRCLAATGHRLDKITGYLGHHDHHHTGGPVREFHFAVTITDPHATSQHLNTNHQWVNLDDPQQVPPTPRPNLIKLSIHHSTPQADAVTS